MHYIWHMFKSTAVLVLCLSLISCLGSQDAVTIDPPSIITGAERMSLYLPKFEGKSVGIVANHTSLVGDTHLVDTLLALGIDIKVIMSPEHGFRGTADAGAKIKGGIDEKTGLPIVSLYGKHRKPTMQDLAGVDIVVFDLQDVGVRFYTYISTLALVMEAAAERALPVIVLDRPNPNAHYVDGPILEAEHSSFVGMHPVPIVYGMTIGEYAKMVNGEGWLDNELRAALTIVPCQHYNRNRPYDLPVPPSPNLPNAAAVALYPSLCLLEGTVVSVGRGTDKQFQVYGHPQYRGGAYTFTPQPNVGAQHPKLKGQECQGVNLSNLQRDSLQRHGFRLDYLINAYQQTGGMEDFFLKNNFFDKLVGNNTVRTQILNNVSEAEIRASWQDGIESFTDIRKTYLIYP